MPKPLTVDHNKLWKILKEMGIPDHLTCLLRNLHAGQEATVRTEHGTTDCFQIGKGIHQGCILSPCLFNFYAEYIMRNTGLEGAQAGIKIARKNIDHLRYTDDTTLMAESEEELQSLLMKVKSESEVAQSCLTLRDPMDWNLPGSSIHRIFQARVLEWVAIWKILKEMGIPAHLTCFLRNLYVGQEETVRTEHGTTDCFQI